MSRQRLDSPIREVQAHSKCERTYDQCLADERGQVGVVSNRVDTAELGINSGSRHQPYNW